MIVAITGFKEKKIISPPAYPASVGKILIVIINCPSHTIV